MGMLTPDALVACARNAARMSWLSLMLVLAGCYSPMLASTAESRLLETGEYDVITGLDVPVVKGPDGCGAQALATVLAFDDDGAPSDALAGELPWHDYGATPIDLLLEARRRGRSARIVRGSWELLAEQVMRDRPALVMLDVGFEVRTLVARYPTGKIMHWAVVSGRAIDDSGIVLAGVDSRHHVLDREEFLKRWSASDYCTILIDGLDVDGSGTPE